MNLRSIRRFALLMIVAIGLSTSLAACGKRGNLEPPPGEPDEFGHQYPDPSLE